MLIDPAAEETLDAAYQPYPAPSPAILRRYRFVPPGAWPQNKKFPTVLMVPPDVFHDPNIIDAGEPHEWRASYDLQFAGFLVFQVETRLASPGKLKHDQIHKQASDDLGTAPEQTDDLKRQILAAINDPQSNGNIYLVGGSAGGTLALWCGLDPASTVTGWDETARAHIKAVVSLSGPTQFCDWEYDGKIPHSKLVEFENNLDGYVGLDDGVNCDPDCTGDVTCALNQASPAWLVTHGATSNPPPIMLYTTVGDHVPSKQAVDMFMALINHYGSTGHDFQEWKMMYTYGSGYEHSFRYWHQINDASGSGECVSEEVINFLQTY